MTAALPLPGIPCFILQRRTEDLLPASCHVSTSHKQLLVSLIPAPLPCGLLLPFALVRAQFTRRTNLYSVHVVFVTHTLLGTWQDSKLWGIIGQRSDSPVIYRFVNGPSLKSDRKLAVFAFSVKFSFLKA